MIIKHDPLDGEIIETSVGDVRKHGKSYISRIIGTDPKYKYSREFVGRSEYDGRRGHKTILKTSELKPVELLEARSSGSWKNDSRDFWLYDRDKIIQPEVLTLINEKQARVILAYILSGGPVPEI